jgi:hypothetical protein
LPDRFCCFLRKRLALFLRAAFSVFAALLLLQPGFASQIRPLNLEQLTRQAGRVVHGRCVDVTASVDAALGQTVTLVSLVPYHPLKGDVHGKLTFKVLGNQTAQAGPGESTEGIPRFEKGEEVVLFLYADSGRGLTSPVGFGQGKFKVIKDKEQASLAVNGFANEHLLEGLSPGALKRIGGRAERLRSRRDIPLDDLLEMVQALAR